MAYISSYSGNNLSDNNVTLGEQIKCVAEAMYEKYKNSIRGTNATNSTDYVQLWKDYWATPDPRYNNTKRDALFASFSGYGIEEGAAKGTYVSYCAVGAWLIYYRATTCFGGIKVGSDCFAKSSRTGTGLTQTKESSVFQLSKARQSRLPATARIGCLMLRESEESAANGHAGIVIDVTTNTITTIEFNGKQTRENGKLMEKRDYTYAELSAYKNLYFFHVQECETVSTTLVTNLPAWCCPEEKPCPDCPTGYRRRDLTDPPPSSRVMFSTDAEYELQKCCVKIQDTTPQCPTCPTGWETRTGAPNEPPDPTAGQIRPPRDNNRDRDPNDPPKVWAEGEWEAWKLLNKCCYRHIYPKEVCPESVSITRITKDCTPGRTTYALKYPNADEVPSYEWFRDDWGNGEGMRQGFFSSVIERSDIIGRHGRTDNTAFMNFIQSVPMVRIGDKSYNCTAMCVVGTSMLNGIMAGSNMPNWVGEADGQAHFDRVKTGLNLYPKPEDAIWIVIPRTINDEGTGAGYAERLANMYFQPGHNTFRSLMPNGLAQALWSLEKYPQLDAIRNDIKNNSEWTGKVWRSNYYNNLYRFLELFEQSLIRDSNSPLRNKTVIFYFPGEPTSAAETLSMITKIVSFAGNLILPGSSLLLNVINATTNVVKALQDGFQVSDLFAITGAIAQQLADDDIAKSLGLDSDIFKKAGTYVNTSANIYNRVINSRGNAVAAFVNLVQEDFKTNKVLPEMIGAAIGNSTYTAIDGFVRGAYRDVNEYLGKTSKEAQGLISTFTEAVTIDRIKTGLSFGDASVANLYQSILGNVNVSISQLGFIQDVLSSRPVGQALTTVPGIQNIVAGAFKVDKIRTNDFTSPEILRSMLGVATGRLALESHFDKLLLDSMLNKAEDFAKRKLQFELPPTIDKCKKEAFYDEIRVCIGEECVPPKMKISGFCVPPPPKKENPPPPPKAKECFEFDGVVKYNHPDGFQCQIRYREYNHANGGAVPKEWRSDKYVYDIVLAIERGDDEPSGGRLVELPDVMPPGMIQMGNKGFIPQRDWEINCGDGWYGLFSGKYGQIMWKTCVPTPPPTETDTPPCIRKIDGKWWFCPDTENFGLNDGEQVSHTLLQRAAAHLGKPSATPLSNEFIDIYNTPESTPQQTTGYITQTGDDTSQYIDMPLSRPGVSTKVPITTTGTNNNNVNTSSVKNPCYPASQDGSGAWFANINNKWVRIIDCKLDSQVECCDKLEKQIEELKRTIQRTKDDSNKIVVEKLNNLQKEFDGQKELLKILVEKVSNVQDYSQKFENIEKRLEEIANKPNPTCDLEPIITLIKNNKSSFSYDDSKIIQRLDEHSKALEILIKRPNAACPDCDTSELAKKIEEQRNAIVQLSNRINETNNNSLLQAIQNLTQQFTSYQNSNNSANYNHALKLNQTYDLIVRLINKPDCCYDDSELKSKIDKLLLEPPKIEKTKDGTYYDDSELRLFISSEFEKYRELLNQKTICPPIIQQTPPSNNPPIDIPPCPNCPPPVVNCPNCPSPCQNYDDRLINKKLDETKELLIRLVEQPDSSAYDDTFVRSKLEQIYSKLQQNSSETRTYDAQLRQYITEQIKQYSQQYNDTDLRSFILNLVSRINPNYDDKDLRVWIEKQIQSVKFDETQLRQFIAQKIAESKSQGFDDKPLREYIYALISQIKTKDYDDKDLRVWIEQKLEQYKSENQAYFTQVASFIVQKIGEIPQQERYNDTSLRQYIASFFQQLPGIYDDRELKRMVQILIDRPSIDITSIQSKLDALLAKQWTVNTTTTGTGQVVAYDDSQLRALILQQMALLQKLQNDCVNNKSNVELISEFSAQKRKLEEIVSLIQNGVTETSLQNSINTISERIKALETVMQNSSTALQLQSLRSDINAQRTLLSTMQSLLSNVQSQLQTKTNYDDTQLKSLLNEIKQSVTFQKNYDDTQLRNQISTLENVIKSLTEQVKNQNNTSSATYNDTALRQQITQLQEAVSRINTSAQSSQFNDTGIMNKLDAMTRELTSVINSRSQYDDTLLRNQLNAMNSLLQTISSRQQQSGSTTYNDTQLRNQVSALDTLIRQVQTDLNNKNFSYNDTALRNQITALDTAVKNIKVTGVAYNDTTIQSKMDTVTAMIKELQSRRAFDDSNIINRLDNLQTQILNELQKKFNYDDRTLRSEIAKLSQYVQNLKLEQSTGTSQYNDTVLQSKIDEIQRNIKDLQSRRAEIYNDSFLREQIGLLRNDISTLLNKKSENYNDSELQKMIKVQTDMIGELLARKCSTYNDAELKSLIMQILGKEQYNGQDVQAEIQKMRNDYAQMQKVFDANFKSLAEKMQPTIIQGEKQTVNCGDCKEKFEQLSQLYSSQQEGWLQRFTALKEQMTRMENIFTERTSGEKSETVSPPSLPPIENVEPRRGKQSGYFTETDCPDCPKVIERHERIIYDFPKRNYVKRKSPCRNC